MLKINKDNFKNQVLESDQPVLVDFWMEGCPPCTMIKPVLEEVSQEFKDKAKIGKVNVRQNMSLATQYKIKGVPTLIVFKGGEVAKRLVGFQKKEKIIKALQGVV